MWPSCGLMLASPGTDYVHCASMHFRIWGFFPSRKLRAGRDWRVDQPGSCPGRQPLGALRRHWNNRKYGADNLRFYTRNNLSENIPQFGHAPSEMFGSSILEPPKKRTVINIRILASGPRIESEIPIRIAISKFWCCVHEQHSNSCSNRNSRVNETVMWICTASVISKITGLDVG